MLIGSLRWVKKCFKEMSENILNQLKAVFKTNF